jgi:hypothetical protein
MNKNFHITAAAILSTLALTGCTIGDTPTATTNTSSPQPTAAQTKKPENVPEPFKNPIVSITPLVPPGSVASLIQPTNSTERLIVVQKGRTDPFGQIVDQIGSRNTGSPGAKIAVPTLPPLPTAIQPKPIPIPIKTTTKPLPTLPKKPAQIASKPVIKKVLPTVLAGSVPSPQLKTILPPAPQPETARAVVVSGVIVIGKVAQAIVKVPDEPTSRYVRTGQRLVNGVLVKRIEMAQSANPTVIFEQYGIEVPKQVEGQPNRESKPSTTVSVVKPQENILGDAS